MNAAVVAQALAELIAAARPLVRVIPDQCPDDGYIHSDDLPIPDRITAGTVRRLRDAVEAVCREVGRASSAPEKTR